MFTFSITKIISEKIDTADGINEQNSCAMQRSPNEFSVSTHFQQLPLWANFKCLHGWHSLCFNITAIINENVEGLSDTSVLEKPLTFTLSVLVRSFKKVFSLAYIPMGPDCIPDVLNLSPNCVLRSENLNLLKKIHLQLCSELAEQLKPFLPSNTICVRMDPPIDFTSPEERASFVFAKKKLQKSSTDIQPPDTVVLDITKPTDVLLKNMKSKWRYNIKLSKRKGVIVKSCGSESIDIFYSLFKQTAERDCIATHAKSYYKSLLELSESQSKQNIEKSKVILYIAFAPADDDDKSEHKLGEPLAGIIVLHVKDGESIYLYGASSNRKRNLMPAYLLQWNAITDAKEFGCKTYDFYGIPPTDDDTHPMHGLWRFKTGFGGKNVHRIGSLDVPLSKMYYLYIKAEKLRAWYYKSFKKKL